ncbi:cobalamin biosynthesis family protein [Vibrio sp. FNV 38]|nr:cobalamin biosynthesis family protein [Vibrio sp. FNV 38]
MEDIIKQLYGNGMVLIMWSAILLQLLLPIPRQSHPMELWRRFALLLSDKVNSTNPKQAMLAGWLSVLLMLIPAAILLIALQPLMWQNELYQLGLLLLALDWRNTDALLCNLTTAMANEDKQQARQLLKPWVNRETQALSLLGLGKAGAETYLLAMGRGVIAVLFWYCLFGGIGAFIYRLTVELARVWSPSRQNFLAFGRAAIHLTALLDYIPLRVFSLFILVGHRAKQSTALLKLQHKSWPLPGSSWLLISSAAKYELSLGGPAIYDTQKCVRAKIGGRIAPAAIHLSQLRQLIFSRLIAWVLCASLILTVVHHGF